MKILALAVFAPIILMFHSSLTLAVDPSDVRLPVTLTPKEYSWLLSEMRGHLDAIGAAQQALSTGDMETARQALLERGTARFKAPGRLSFPQKVPDAWKSLALGMHQSFDAAAEGIANKESASQIMGRTARLMQHCAGCHVSYRLVEAP